jgi:hypothetical protein
LKYHLNFVPLFSASSPALFPQFLLNVKRDCLKRLKLTKLRMAGGIKGTGNVATKFNFIEICPGSFSLVASKDPNN